MQALNYWIEPNERFYRAINSKQREEVRKGIKGILASYKVARSFKGLGSAVPLLNLFNKIKPLTKTCVVDSVEGFAEKINIEYGQKTISAASKLLWFKDRNTVVIYDELARRTLATLSGVKLKKGEYRQFYVEWNKQFKLFKTDIEKASFGLYKVKIYSSACGLTDDEIKKITKSGWFHKRVFDYYLWLNGKYL